MSGIYRASAADILYPYPYEIRTDGEELPSEEPITYEAAALEEVEEKRYLYFAVECGYQSVVVEKLSIDPKRVYYVYNDDMMGCDDNRNTLMHVAAMNAQEKVLEILVKAGAVVNVINGGGDTPLHFAASVKSSVRFLLEHGAINSLNVRNNKGYRPLDISILRASSKDVEYLLSQGAKYDHMDERGNTPLHYAAGIFRNDEESKTIAKLLLEKGLSATKKNNEGLIPFEIASKSFNVGAAEAMLESSQRADIKKYLERKHNWETIDHASAWESIDHPVISQMVMDLIKGR